MRKPYKPQVETVLPFLIIAIFCISSAFGQQPTDACDRYSLVGGVPKKQQLGTLTLRVFEASAADLQNAAATDDRYRSELFIWGNLNNQPPAIANLTLSGGTTDFKPKDYFTIITDPTTGKKYLKLNAPIDRDDLITGVNTVEFNINCRKAGSSLPVVLPVYLNIQDINDNPPLFMFDPYSTSVNELTPIGNTIYRGIAATDLDEGSNAEIDITFSAMETGVFDATQYFAIDLPRSGYVTLKSPLDYEAIRKRPYYLLNITASDRPADVSKTLVSFTTLRVNITDADDLPPAFIYAGCVTYKEVCVNPQYTADIISNGGVSSALTVKPAAILARDQDSLNFRISYSITNGIPSNWSSYFTIDKTTGVITQTAPIDRISFDEIKLYIKAEEISVNQRYNMATLTINVVKANNFPPTITSSLGAGAFTGWVRENSPVGYITSNQAFTQQFQLIVTDKDVAPGDPPPKYTWSVTNTNWFRVDAQGFVVVNTNTLDYEQSVTKQVQFKATVTEADTAQRRSTTADITVNIVDVNDNTPIFSSPTGYTNQLKEGTGTRNVLQVAATDADTGLFGTVRYSIVSTTAANTNLFTINPTTGQIQVMGPVNRGQQYVLNVRAEDQAPVADRRFSITHVTINVIRDKNLPPQIDSASYTRQVSEAAHTGSRVFQLVAKDPESDKLMYSITGGDTNQEFAIDPNTGIVTVAKPLDYETKPNYALTLQATDTVSNQVCLYAWHSCFENTFIDFKSVYFD
ncbi:cadherin-99C-like [Tubulanus polymorphus]|uniref:cadherin-99C-like n=1 Tax=Tubulanus polymorphus TaxID=672921 RepID=UPI003DA5ED37